MIQDNLPEVDDFQEAFKHLRHYMNLVRLPRTGKEILSAGLGWACVGISVTVTLLDMQREATNNLVARADDVLHVASEWCHNKIDELEG